MSYRFLVGGLTDSVTTLEFNAPSSKRPGELSIVASQKVGECPGWVTQSEEDPSVFYAGKEGEDGRILTLLYDSETGKGEIIGDVSSGGDTPCSILPLDGEVLVANYMSGTVAVYEPDSKGKLTLKQPVFKFSGTGPNEVRQEGPHTHQVYPICRGDHKEVLVPDLGTDLIYRLKKNEEGIWEVAGYVVFDEHSGGGPRHVVFYENVLYTLLELTLELTAHTLPPLSTDVESSPELLASASTLTSPPASSDPAMIGAELLVAPPSASYPNAYIYASNRNDPHPEGDTIAIFKPLSSENPGSLELVNEVRTGLNHVKAFIFFGPDDRFLIAGGTFGGGIKVFERVNGGVSLKEIA
ncbi:putative isomerase YbhE, partial [Schizopora paradoxa]